MKEGLPTWKLYPLCIFHTIGIAAMLIVAAAMFVLGPEAIEWFARQFGLEQLFVTLWTWLRWPVVVFLLTLALAVVCCVAPDAEQSFRFITPGATLAVIVRIAVSAGFNVYISHFANYYATHGSIGAIIVLLLYFVFVRRTAVRCGDQRGNRAPLPAWQESETKVASEVTRNASRHACRAIHPSNTCQPLRAKASV